MARVMTGSTPEGIRGVLGEYRPCARRLFQDDAPADIPSVVSMTVDNVFKTVRVRAAQIREERTRRYGVAFSIVLVLIAILLGPAALPALRSMALKPPQTHTCVFRVKTGCTARLPAGPDAECAWRPSWQKPLQCKPIL